MAGRSAVKVTYEAGQVIEPFYTGGTVAISKDGFILATCLSEDVVLTNPMNGQRLARVEGVSRTISAQELGLTRG